MKIVIDSEKKVKRPGYKLSEMYMGSSRDESQELCAYVEALEAVRHAAEKVAASLSLDWSSADMPNAQRHLVALDAALAQFETEDV